MSLERIGNIGIQLPSTPAGVPTTHAHYVEFATPGSHTALIPITVDKIWITACGGGGNGAGTVGVGVSDNMGYSGSGGGLCYRKEYTPVGTVVGSNYSIPITVGNGGIHGGVNPSSVPPTSTIIGSLVTLGCGASIPNPIFSTTIAGGVPGGGKVGSAESNTYSGPGIDLDTRTIVGMPGSGPIFISVSEGNIFSGMGHTSSFGGGGGSLGGGGGASMGYGSSQATSRMQGVGGTSILGPAFSGTNGSNTAGSPTTPVVIGGDGKFGGGGGAAASGSTSTTQGKGGDGYVLIEWD